MFSPKWHKSMVKVRCGTLTMYISHPITRVRRYLYNNEKNPITIPQSFLVADRQWMIKLNSFSTSDRSWNSPVVDVLNVGREVFSKIQL